MEQGEKGWKRVAFSLDAYPLAFSRVYIRGRDVLRTLSCAKGVKREEGREGQREREGRGEARRREREGESDRGRAKRMVGQKRVETRGGRRGTTGFASIGFPVTSTEVVANLSALKAAPSPSLRGRLLRARK